MPRNFLCNKSNAINIIFKYEKKFVYTSSYPKQNILVGPTLLLKSIKKAKKYAAEMIKS